MHVFPSAACDQPHDNVNKRGGTHLYKNAGGQRRTVRNHKSQFIWTFRININHHLPPAFLGSLKEKEKLILACKVMLMFMFEKLLLKMNLS